MDVFNKILVNKRQTVDFIIYQIIKEFFFLVGLLPFNVKISECLVQKSTLVFEFSPSRNRCVYNGVAVFLFILYIFWENDDVGWITSTYHRVICGTSASMILTYCYSNQQLLAIGNCIAEYDRTVPMALWKFYDCKSITFHMIIVITATLSIWLLASLLALLNATDLTMIIIAILDLIYNCFWIQYIMIIVLLEKRLSGLNVALMKIAKADMKRHVVSVLSPDGACRSRTERHVVVIRKARNILYSIAYRVEECYSLPALIAIMQCCCALIYTGYFAVSPLIFQKPTPTAFSMYNYFWWNIQYLWILAYFSISVDKLTDKAQETIIIVYDIIEVYDNSATIKSLLTDFTYESLNRRLNFTACTMFQLNCNLLLSILNMMGTYLVIALQYIPNNAS